MGEHRLDNAAEVEQYRAAGFGGRVGWGKKPALLVIDMAGAWTSKDEELGSNLSNVTESICKLLDEFRSRNLPCYFTTMAYDPAMREVGEVVSSKLTHLT